ncbi:hypothetical protein [Spiroplasma endosymbiont of Cantharis lateralis]|uniref:hypothetical protein n=1 Tax=Spiroplasma endosymbiont of Cantharis lateralis TaxID=3066277 RepID=UPI00313E7B81
MAYKKKKAFFEDNDSVSQILEDLLDLSLIKFDDKPVPNKYQIPNIANDIDNKTIIKKIKPLENSEVKNLDSIIKNARQMNNIFSKSKWINNSVEEEEFIIEKAKKEGKSAYDSDVLRQLILERQKKKKESLGLSSIINKAKKRK